MRNWEKIGLGPLTLSTAPETTDLRQATIGAIAVACAAFAYQLNPLHFQGTFRVQDVVLDFTFLSLAMLVVGGAGSLWARSSAGCSSAGSTRSSATRRTTP